MAIGKDNNQGTAEQAQAQAAPQQQAAPKASPKSLSTGSFLANLNNLGNGLVAQSIGGEYFTKMREKMVSVSSALLADGLEAKIFGINAKEFNLKFSAIVIAINYERNASSASVTDNLVGYHVMVLEATGDKLPMEYHTIDQRSVPVRRVTGDAADRVLMTLADETIRRNYPNWTVLSSGAQVVPSSVQLSSDDVIESIVRNASLACVSQVLQEARAFDEINLSKFPKDSRLDIQIVTGQGTSYNEVGAPQRASAVLTMSIVNNSVRRDIRQALDVVNTEDNSLKFCEVTGFINPVWAPIGSEAVMYHQPQQQQQQTPKLAAEFVITGIRSPYASSPAAVCMAIASAYALGDENKWLQLLFPVGQQRDGKSDLTDIGGLNVICDIFNEKAKGIFGTAASIASMNGDAFKISQYISALFQPGMILSIDCEEAGPHSWITNPFIASALGDSYATGNIINAIDELTNGLFSNFYDGSSPIITGMMRVPLGHYIADGKKRDIRDVDLTTICNVFASNPEQIHEYNSTFQPRTGFSEPALIAAREGFISHALRDQLEITGYARRLTFGQKFLMAFSSAIAANHLNTTVQTPLSVEQFRVGTPAPDYIQQSLMANTRTFSGIAMGAAPRTTFGNFAGMNFRR